MVVTVNRGAEKLLCISMHGSNGMKRGFILAPYAATFRFQSNCWRCLLRFLQSEAGFSYIWRRNWSSVHLSFMARLKFYHLDENLLHINLWHWQAWYYRLQVFTIGYFSLNVWCGKSGTRKNWGLLFMAIYHIRFSCRITRPLRLFVQVSPHSVEFTLCHSCGTTHATRLEPTFMK